MRLNILIGAKLQLRFLAVALLCNFFISAGFAFASYRFIYVFKSKALSVGLAENHFFFQFLSDQQVLLYTLTAIGCVFSVLIVSLSMLYLTHKVAGPVYRIKTDLTAMLKTNEYRNIKIREGDELQDVVVLLNDILDKLSTLENHEKL
jgi:signal transduction histidine kinase